MVFNQTDSTFQQVVGWQQSFVDAAIVLSMIMLSLIFVIVMCFF